MQLFCMGRLQLLFQTAPAQSTRNVVELAMGPGVVRPVLHDVQIGGAHVKWFQNFVETGSV
jgi:hypothetical protein